MKKNDGSWTYFANDVGYHMDKISRNYKYLINVLGAIHSPRRSRRDQENNYDENGKGTI